MMMRPFFLFFFFFNDTATTEIYTLSLHDALPICSAQWTRITPSRLSHPRDQLPANFVRSLVVDQTGTLYAGTADNGVYVSTDRGETWRIIGGELGNASVPGVAIGGPPLFRGAGGGM